MPNHCYNQLYVMGEPSDLDQFLAKIDNAFEQFGLTEDGRFTFTAFVPYTDNVLTGTSGTGKFVRRNGVWESTSLSQSEADSAGLEFYSGAYCEDSSGIVYTQFDMQDKGLVDWYSWNIDNWGTKWDAYSIDVERVQDNQLTIRFDSAWAPPSPVIHAMQEQHPELSITLEFEEPGMMFRGEIHEDGTEFTEDYEEEVEYS